jgi:phage-related minor tail protein
MVSFAEGGSVRGGMPITVGERGRELFVPNTSGTIVPNHELANSGMNITFNIQANDVRGIKELLIDNRATIINLVNQGANQKGKSNIV